MRFFYLLGEQADRALVAAQRRFFTAGMVLALKMPDRRAMISILVTFGATVLFAWFAMKDPEWFHWAILSIGN